MSFYTLTLSTFLSKLDVFSSFLSPIPSQGTGKNRLEQNRFKRFENLFGPGKLPNDKDANEPTVHVCDPNDLFTSVSDPLKDLLEKTAKESKFVINGLSRRLELTSPNRQRRNEKAIESLKKNGRPFGTKRNTMKNAEKSNGILFQPRKAWPSSKPSPIGHSLIERPKPLGSRKSSIKTIVDPLQRFERKSGEIERERFLLEKKEVLPAPDSRTGNHSFGQEFTPIQPPHAVETTKAQAREHRLP